MGHQLLFVLLLIDSRASNDSGVGCATINLGVLVPAGGNLRLLREGLHDHCFRNSHLDLLKFRAVFHVL